MNNTQPVPSVPIRSSENSAPAKSRTPLKPLAEALTELLGHATPLSHPEQVSTFDADGRVLAQSIIAELLVPPNDNSAMDGYAVRTADVAAPGTWLPVTQRIPAGSVGHALQSGSAARIFTGAPIPSGADAVVMQEDAELVMRDGDQPGIQVKSVPSEGQWIRRAGEDVALGAEVLSSGTRLLSASLGMAASVGKSHLMVSRQPRIALFSTGDELVMPGEIEPSQMKPGAIYNSNRFFLRSMLMRLGCRVTDLGIVPDRRDETIEALRQAALQHDLVLTSGGVSVGEEDHVKPAVQSLGQLDLWQIAIKPGKPFAYGKIQRSPDQFAHFMGLPGNPVSSFVTFLLLVRPFVLRLQGAVDIALKPVALRADFNWPRADKRREFLRVRLNAQGGLDLFPNQSSGVLTSAVWGDGLVDNPPGQVIRAGEMVQYLPFSELLT